MRTGEKRKYGEGKAFKKYLKDMFCNADDLKTDTSWAGEQKHTL